MVYKRDCHILILLGILLLYLWFRVMGLLNGVYCYTDHLAILYILYSIWFIVFNSRLYVMTRKRLCRICNQVSSHCALEYKTYEHMGIIERIWVKVDNETYPNWYELDYLACGIDKGTCINVLNTFMSYNTTVGDLLHSMNCHLQDKLHYEKYDIMKSDYQCFRWLSFLGIFFVSIFYIVILFNFVYSREELLTLFDLLGI